MMVLSQPAHPGCLCLPACPPAVCPPPPPPPPLFGPQGKRAALRSSTIMIRQPLQRLSGMQASDIDIYRRVTREKTHVMVRHRGEGGEGERVQVISEVTRGLVEGMCGGEWCD